MVANFSIGVGDKDTKIIVTDTSTANYGGETIVSRTLIIEDVNGGSVSLPFPVVIGVGDGVQYDIGAIKAVRITMNIVTVQNAVAYSVTKAYAPLVHFDSYIDSLEDSLFNTFAITPTSPSSLNILRQLELVKAVVDSIGTSIGLVDLRSAQECLDYLINITGGSSWQ